MIKPCYRQNLYIYIYFSLIINQLLLCFVGLPSIEFYLILFGKSTNKYATAAFFLILKII